MSRAKARLQPLLRTNDWSLAQARQELEIQGDAVRRLEVQLDRAERELVACYARVKAKSGGEIRQDAYALANHQAAAWMLSLQALKAKLEQERDALTSIRGRCTQLKHQRHVIERRRDELIREEAQGQASREAADQADLWLTRSRV